MGFSVARLLRTRAGRRTPSSPQHGRCRWPGARAEKIRTYNFPESRVTDHRIKLTRQHQLDRVLHASFEPFTEALTAEVRQRALA